MSDLIYLDYMSTTPVDPSVGKVMHDCLTIEGDFGNPASNTHRFGFLAKERVSIARKAVADLVGADAKEIIFTSGATEAINLALKGAAMHYQRQGKHIITMQTEHKAGLDVCAWLESMGFEVTYLPPQPSGLLDLELLQSMIRDDTILVSIMHVNNETGVIQDIQAIGEMLKERGVLFHVDAAQSLGKVPINLSELPVSLMSFSAHKIYGPKGCGALYVRRRPRVQLVPQMHGGGHEMGLRSGTLPVHQIAGMGAACAIAQSRFSEDVKRIRALRDRLYQGVMSLEGIRLHGDLNQCVYGCMNISVAGVDGESLIHSLYDLAISQGSACNAANPEPSHVLSAMGVSRQEANRSLRISVGRFTSEADIDRAILRITEQVSRLRAISPLWVG